MILVIVLVCMRVEREIIKEEEDKVGGLRDGLSSISDHKIVASEE